MEPVKYKTLVIVESPTKCRTIEKYLGPSYMCVACCGHLREISDGLAGIGIGGGGSYCVARVPTIQSTRSYHAAHNVPRNHANRS